MLIELTNEDSSKLIHDLQDLNLIKIIKSEKSLKPKLSDKFKGSLKLSDEEYNAFQNHLDNSRNEWEHRVI